MSEDRTEITRPDIARTLEAGTVAAKVVGRDLDKKADRSTVWIAAAVSAAISCAVSIAVAVPGAIQGAKQAAVADTIASQQVENRERADAAYEAAVAANEELRRRGQPEVPVPEPDGRGDDLDTFIPAAVAGVLAALPEQVRAPSAGDLGRAVAAYMSTNPAPGPSPAQIAEAVAAFLRANPPADNPDPNDPDPVDDTDPNDPDPVDDPDPTDDPDPDSPPDAEQIRAAIAAELEANPNVLCTYGGGTWQKLDNVVLDATPLEVVETDATTVTIWACVPTQGEEPE